jgi:hypothetical protein
LKLVGLTLKFQHRRREGCFLNDRNPAAFAPAFVSSRNTALGRLPFHRTGRARPFLCRILALRAPMDAIGSAQYTNRSKAPASEIFIASPFCAFVLT